MNTSNAFVSFSFFPTSNEALYTSSVRYFDKCSRVLGWIECWSGFPQLVGGVLLLQNSEGNEGIDQVSDSMDTMSTTRKCKPKIHCNDVWTNMTSILFYFVLFCCKVPFHYRTDNMYIGDGGHKHTLTESNEFCNPNYVV